MIVESNLAPVRCTVIFILEVGFVLLDLLILRLRLPFLSRFAQIGERYFPDSEYIIEEQGCQYVESNICPQDPKVSPLVGWRYRSTSQELIGVPDRAVLAGCYGVRIV